MMELVAKALEKVAVELCELRNDMFNQALITRPETFAASEPIRGTKRFEVADMPPQTTAKSIDAYTNKSKVPVVAFVRVEPVMIAAPPDPISIENAVLLVTVNGNATDVTRAALCEASQGKITPVLLKPNDTLSVSVMASQPVTVSWRVVPMRGRANVFGNESR